MGLTDSIAAARSMLNSVIPRGKNKYEDEDIRLWKEYKAGNKEAGWDLLNRFKSTINSHAAKFSNVLPRPAVEAKLKKYTMQAFDTYDPSKGTKLSTHVYNYLQQINRDNYKHQQAVRLPENYARGFSKYTDGKRQLYETLGREPTTEELAKHLGWSESVTGAAEQKYHTELVEGKQEFSAGVEGPDIASSALRFAYEGMSEPEKFLLKHKTGYMGSEIYPVGVIKDKLGYTPHKFSLMQKSVESKVRDAYDALGQESDKE